jgi:hypothetical protein
MPPEKVCRTHCMNPTASIDAVEKKNYIPTGHLPDRPN